MRCKYVEVNEVKKAIAFGLIALLGLSLCAVAQVKNPDTLIIVTIGDQETSDPANAYDNASGNTIGNVYESLLRYVGGSMDLEPSLATIVPSLDNGLISPTADGYTLVTFPIRSGVKFHSGNVLTPADVEYTFERFQVTDSTGGPQWMLFNGLYGFEFNVLEDLIAEFGEDGAKQKIQESVQVVGDSVVFKLKGPARVVFDSVLNNNCYWGGVMEKAWCIDNGAWPGTWDIALGTDYRIGADASSSPLYNVSNGTGPYVFTEWIPLEERRFAAFADYWGGWAGDHVQNVVIRSMDEWGTRKLTFLQGDADICYVPTQYKEQMEYTPGIRTVFGYTILSNRGLMFMNQIDVGSPMIHSGEFDGQGIPPTFFEDVHVRRAFNYCMDSPTYAEQAWLGEAQPAWNSIPPSLPGSFKDENYRYHYDLEKAEEEFKLAYDGALWDIGFKMTLEYNLGNDQRKVAAEIVELSIEGLNPLFQVEVLGLDWPSHLAASRANQFAAHVTGWGADYPHIYNFAYPYYHSLGTFMQFQQLGIADMDDMILAAVQTPFPAANDLWADVQKLAYDLAPNVPLVDAAGRVWERTWVNGRYFHNTGVNYYFYGIWKAEGGPGYLVDTVNFPSMQVSEW